MSDNQQQTQQQTQPAPEPKGPYQQSAATPFPVLTDGRIYPVVVVGMGQKAKQREKPSPMGEATYGTGCVLLALTKDGEVMGQKTTSIHVINPDDVYPVGQKYRGEGRIYVQPYESNGRMAYSITVERLVPIK